MLIFNTLKINFSQLLTFWSGRGYTKEVKFFSMNKPFYSLGLGTLALMIFWSCTLEEIASPQQAVLVDPLPVARSYYDLEKPKQGNLYGRIQSDLEVFP
ncbi:hypothetical protein DDT91_10730 [Algoriphagus sp. AK58]|nr:hypothetical protein [Algoriphagus sp. AK58]